MAKPHRKEHENTVKVAKSTNTGLWAFKGIWVLFI